MPRFEPAPTPLSLIGNELALHLYWRRHSCTLYPFHSYKVATCWPGKRISITFASLFIECQPECTHWGVCMCMCAHAWSKIQSFALKTKSFCQLTSRFPCVFVMNFQQMNTMNAPLRNLTLSFNTDCLKYWLYFANRYYFLWFNFYMLFNTFHSNLGNCSIKNWS